MKIGIAGTIWINTPPEKYGGTESVIHTLSAGLTNLGHDVTVFGPKTSNVESRLIHTLEKPLLEMGVGFDDYATLNYHMYHFLEIFKRAHDFDLIHIHLNKNHDYISLPLAMYSRTPVLFTLHFPAPTPKYRPEKYLILNQFKHLPFTSISDAARSGNIWNFVNTVYNAIDIKQFPYVPASEDYFAWIGKAIPIKGLKEAIEVAKRAGVKLKIMAAVEKGNPLSEEYFASLLPQIDGKQIEYLGEADVEMKARVLGGAKAFINPIQWPEPFGLVMAEAQAVGTPVLVLNKGAASELVIDKKTGFVVDSVSEMVEKVNQLDCLKREDCRKHIEENFTSEKMINGYLESYRTTIKNWAKYQTKQLQELGFN